MDVDYYLYVKLLCRLPVFEGISTFSIPTVAAVMALAPGNCTQGATGEVFSNCNDSNN